MTYKFLRSINGKAKVPKKMSYKNTSLCSDFESARLLTSFLASVYKIGNEPLNFLSERIFPEIYLSDTFVSHCEIRSELSKCKSKQIQLMVYLLTY